MDGKSKAAAHALREFDAKTAPKNDITTEEPRRRNKSRPELVAEAQRAEEHSPDARKKPVSLESNKTSSCMLSSLIYSSLIFLIFSSHVFQTPQTSSTPSKTGTQHQQDEVVDLDNVDLEEIRECGTDGESDEERTNPVGVPPEVNLEDAGEEEEEDDGNKTSLTIFSEPPAPEDFNDKDLDEPSIPSDDVVGETVADLFQVVRYCNPGGAADLLKRAREYLASVDAGKRKVTL